MKRAPHPPSRWRCRLPHLLGPGVLQEPIAVLPRVGLAKYLTYLLKGEAFRLNHEEVDHQDLESIPHREDNVNCGGVSELGGFKSKKEQSYLSR